MHLVFMPPTISLGDLEAFARTQGCRLGQTTDGDFYFYPTEPADQPFQTNHNIVKIPRHKNQLHGNAGNTTPPDLAG